MLLEYGILNLKKGEWIVVCLECDYNNGACEPILRRLLETNGERLPGYGSDRYSESAKAKIRAACGCETAEVEFLAGGTQTNAVVIAALLRDHEGVVCVSTGHINSHEAGAVEYTGHKILSIPGELGKLPVDGLRSFLQQFHSDANREHMVWPGLVYISYPTEYGTLYSKSELSALSAVCREYSVPLYLDGARLGYGLMSSEADLTLQDIAELCDVFYIGGTKVGALCGEAVVFSGIPRPEHFLHSVKKRGALLAKGRLIGLQFDALFTDDLYFRLGRHGIRMAEKMKAILKERGISFFLETPTNQQFILLEDRLLTPLSERVSYSYWEKADDTHTVIRLATSWATTEEELEELQSALRTLGG